MAQNKFKTGDRIYWKGNDQHTLDPDSGTVMPNDCTDTYLPGGSVWVKWDSGGTIMYIDEHKIDFEQTKEQSELTVQSCLDFLIDQGYSVTLKKG